jgi:hypothetical protein
VRRHEAPQWLELEAHAGPLGTARIALDIRPWGEKTLVILDEHPLCGFGGTIHNAALEPLLQIRHRSMLARLAEVVESGSGSSTTEELMDDHRAPAMGQRKGRR